MEHFITLCCNKGRNGKLTDRNSLFLGTLLLSQKIPCFSVDHIEILHDSRNNCFDEILNGTYFSCTRKVTFF